jgi:hypothetical protein
MSVILGRTASSESGPQRCHLSFKPRRCCPGGGGFGRRLQQLSHEAIGALAFVLEICAIAGGPGLKLRDLCLQRHDECPQLSGLARPVTGRWLRRMPDFSEINAHQRFPIIGKRARQSEPPGKRAGGRGRDIQAGAQGCVGQNLNGHRLFSSNEPRWNRLMMTG